MTLLALPGPSGCGKTTTLRLIAGLLQPDDGTLFITSRPIFGVPPSKRDVGIVFQSYALFPHMTVGSNVAFGLEIRSVAKREVGERDRRPGHSEWQPRLRRAGGRGCPARVRVTSVPGIA